MTSDTPELQAILRRIKTLETANRRLRRTALVVIVLAAAGVLGMCQARHGRTVDADRLILRDKQGRIRVEVALLYDTGPDGYPVVRLLDKNGIERSGLGAGVLTMRDEKGSIHATLLDDTLQFENGSSGVSVRLGSDIGHRKGGGGSLWLYGSPESGSAILLNSESPVVELSDDKGFTASLGKTLLTIDKTGESRQRSAASLVMSGKDGKVLWSAP